MKVEEIVKIIEALGKTHLTEFYLQDKDFTLKIGKETINTIAQAQQQTEYMKEPMNEKIETYVPMPPQVTQETQETQEPQEPKVEIKQDNLLKVTSPMVGTFYQAPSPESSSFVKVGDVVEQGDTLCIIEAMKLMNEIESTESGKVVKVLVENGELVEYGQTLFLIEKA